MDPDGHVIWAIPMALVKLVFIVAGVTFTFSVMVAALKSEKGQATTVANDDNIFVNGKQNQFDTIAEEIVLSMQRNKHQFYSC